MNVERDSPKKQMKKNSEKEKIKKMLELRARGYTFGMIASIFHLSRQGVQHLIEKNRSEPDFRDIYREIEKTQKFLKRNFEPGCKNAPDKRDRKDAHGSLQGVTPVSAAEGNIPPERHENSS